MSRLSAMDLAFFAAESTSRPMHGGGVLVFDRPAELSPRDLVERTLAAFRATVPTGRPWNCRPVLGGMSLPHWETVPEIDMTYHVRRVTLPAPGSQAQLMELVSQLYPALLDRSRPLWETYVIDGLEGDRMAVFIKGHHALADGVSGIRMFLASLSESPDDDPRPLWSVAAQPGADSPAADERRGPPVIGSIMRQIGGLVGMAPALAALAPDAIALACGAALPFSAARTEALSGRISSARSFASLDLPLSEVKRIGRQFDATVNDVVLSVCDDAMQRYVRATGGSWEAGRMVATVAISIRRGDDQSASNAATATLLKLGAPTATPVQRLAEIVTATKRMKATVSGASLLPLRLQMLGVLAGLELREQLPIGRATVPPLSNFVLSNISGGSKTALYLGRAKLAGFYVAPIVAGGQAANFTLLSYEDSLCVGIGAARNIIPDTSRLAGYLRKSFEQLQAGADAAAPPTSAEAPDGPETTASRV